MSDLEQKKVGVKLFDVSGCEHSLLLERHLLLRCRFSSPSYEPALVIDLHTCARRADLVYVQTMSKKQYCDRGVGYSHSRFG